jgi:hypothetical protein
MEQQLDIEILNQPCISIPMAMRVCIEVITMQSGHKAYNALLGSGKKGKTSIWGPTKEGMVCHKVSRRSKAFN